MVQEENHSVHHACRKFCSNYDGIGISLWLFFKRTGGNFSKKETDSLNWKAFRSVKNEAKSGGERRGRELEREQSILNHTKLLSQKLNITVDEAMAILEVPEDTQKMIRPKLVP